MYILNDKLSITMAHITNFPYEILSRIFHFYLETESLLNFINNVSNVCAKWNEVCKDTAFYQKIDGTLPNNLLVKLANSGSLKMTKSLTFGKPLKKLLTPKATRDYKCIYKSMPFLEYLDLTYICRNLDKLKTHAVFTELEGECPQIREIIFCQADVTCKAYIRVAIFEPTLTLRGRDLAILDFSNLDLKGVPSFFSLVAKTCPNLEGLLAQNLQGAMTHRFPTELMQKGCPKLKVLRLGFPITFIRRSYKDLTGFPNLEIFTHPSRNDSYVTSSDLEALLFKSPNLKIFDIRGCKLISFDVISSLPATDLSHMYVAWTSTSSTSGLIKSIQKWSHSLIVLDISHAKGRTVLDVFNSANFPSGIPCLECLDLNNTGVGNETVRFIIENFPKLRSLNLESCHGLMRGTKKIYQSRSEIEKLLSKLCDDEVEWL